VVQPCRVQNGPGTDAAEASARNAVKSPSASTHGLRVRFLPDRAFRTAIGDAVVLCGLMPAPVVPAAAWTVTRAVSVGGNTSDVR